MERDVLESANGVFCTFASGFTDSVCETGNDYFLYINIYKLIANLYMYKLYICVLKWTIYWPRLWETGHFQLAQNKTSFQPHADPVWAKLGHHEIIMRYFEAVNALPF